MTWGATPRSATSLAVCAKSGLKTSGKRIAWPPLQSGKCADRLAWAMYGTTMLSTGTDMGSRPFAAQTSSLQLAAVLNPSEVTVLAVESSH